MAPQLIVLGWDSATFDVADPLMEQGRLPALSSLLSEGFRAPLRSTWPPMTDCAWTSAFTGVNPGAHGIFGSWYRAPGEYRCRYFSSRDRRAPALWELGSDVRFLVWNVPMTYPATALDGVMVAGYGAPPGASFCLPTGFQGELAGRWPLEDLTDRAPHSSLESFRTDLLCGLSAQAAALPWAIERSGADCVAAVWPHIDRAQHFFWRFRDRSHPLSGVVDEVYEAMDAATGAVLQAFPEADVLVVSDHGAGPLKGDVNVGAWLEDNGHAVYGAPPRSRSAELAWALPPPVRRFGRRIFPSIARRALGATLESQLGPFEWSSTRAFVGFHGDLWLNLKGREPQGTVAESEADEVLDELAGGLLEVSDPRSGERVFAGAHRRADLYSGPVADLAPDLMLDSWSAGYRIAPRRDRSELLIAPSPLAGVGEAWSSDHRPVGIFIASGPRIARGSADELSLLDVCPTALALLDSPVPADLDGRVAREAISEGWLDGHPVVSSAGGTKLHGGGAYSEDEAGAVASHLKELGYIE